MTRASWHTYQSFLGLPGTPIEFTDRYILSDLAPEQAQQQRYDEDPIGFAHYNDRVRDLTPRSLDLPPGTHPFPTRFCRSNSQLMFNITDLAHQLTEDILIAGGHIETREFHTPSDLAALPQKVIVNCTGYGARALFSDSSLTPVRGQIGWLIPQPEALYGLVYNNLNVLSRRDGIVVQLSEQGEASGWNNTDETPRPPRGRRRRAPASCYLRPHGARQPQAPVDPAPAATPNQLLPSPVQCFPGRRDGKSIASPPVAVREHAVHSRTTLICSSGTPAARACRRFASQRSRKTSASASLQQLCVKTLQQLSAHGIAARSNRRSDRHPKILRSRSELLPHPLDAHPGDTRRRPPPARMKRTRRMQPLIRHQDRHTIRRQNAKQQPGRIGHQSIPILSAITSVHP